MASESCVLSRKYVFVEFWVCVCILSHIVTYFTGSTRNSTKMKLYEMQFRIRFKALILELFAKKKITNA